MKHRLLASVALGTAVLFTGLPVQAQDKKPFTYEDLISLDRISGLAVDKTESFAAFQVRVLNAEKSKGVNGLWLTDLKTKTSKPLTVASKGGALSPQWGADGALYFLSARSGSMQVWKTDTKDSEAVQVTKLALDVGAYKLSPDGKGVVVALAIAETCETDEIACTLKVAEAKKAEKSTGVVYDRLFVRHWDTWADGTQNHLFYVPLAGGEAVSLTAGVDGDVPSKPFGDESEYSFSPDGKSVYYSVRIAGKDEPRSTNFDIYKVDIANPTVQTNLTEANTAWDTGAEVSPDGKWLAYRAMKRAGFEADQFEIFLRNLATGETKQIAADWDRSADSLKWAADGKSLYVVAGDVGKTPLFQVDIATNKVTPLSKGGHMDAFAPLKTGFVFMKSSLDTPSQLFVSQPKAKLIDDGATKLTTINDAVIGNRAFGAFEQFSFKGWNDETVHGYILKPANYVEGQKYPIAFLIHGGPQGSFGESWSYRWNPETYAGAGYAVIMIDFHGSTGYGQGFTDAISQHWGDRPLEDLQKGYAFALSKYNFLDKDRACALGASYGGFMINWIASQWKEPWKCLVNHDGLFDNRSMGYATEELWFSEWENGGTVYEKPENYDKFNPALHSKDWSVPMLVIHSDQDFRVIPEQGIGTFTALQMNGVKSKFLRFPDENHWVLKPQNSLKWHNTVFDWLNENTKAK
ncbi:S9 family peptidase [Asticcacaulis sp. BYS171W]|uniref:S9 family peptidase n=1 Tax=Asticcacaulis aquaticus TaxID=2984212 RepID=A0ABT5HQP7_9CAUL|nr:S9 family peptidase [Asticcacaulis aquaticus]MDC7682364.1 S9 family peptidase [Asticcacaulis aquaticus]